MKKNFFAISRTLHLVTGLAAAALAFNTKKKNNWRYPLLAVAAWEIWNGLTLTDAVEEIPFEKAPENIRTKTIKGVVNRWEEHGDSSPDDIPVIMVHGLPTNPRVWRYIIPQVAKKGVRCLAWEQVGFGWSLLEGLGLDLSIPKQAEYLYDWLQHLGITKAVFVGHDYGGGVIQQLLVNHPELAAAVVLTDSVAYKNWPVKAVRMARSMRKKIEKLPHTMVKPIFVAGLTNLGHQNQAIKEESVKLYWEPYTQSFGPRAFAHQLSYFSSDYTKTVSKQLDKIKLKVPARVVWGTKDPLGLSSGKKLSKALNAPLIKIPGGKHFTIEDHPEVIAKAINEVLEEVRELA